MATTTGKRGGRRPGAGRKPMREEAELQRLVAEVIPYETRAEILKAVIAKAVQGDLRAANIALAYACGRPAVATFETNAPNPPVDDTRKNDQFAHDIVTCYGDMAFPEGAEGPNSQPPDPTYLRAIATALDADAEASFPMSDPEAQPSK